MAQNEGERKLGQARGKPAGAEKDQGDYEDEQELRQT